MTGDSRTLGKYTLVAELARGGMGLVYLAASSGVGGFSKLLVVKELKPELVDDGTFLEMFLEEARLAARLNHPNIVTTYEVGIEQKRPFIVMDFLDGQTLSRVLRKDSRALSIRAQLRILAESLEALSYAHERKDFDGNAASVVVHRDVSPQNVFVTYDGQVKLVDFGIAKASDSQVETRTGVFKGKPAYMAPEQLRGEVDPRADVYAVGVMLWEALAGEKIWGKKSELEILTAVLKEAIPSIDEAAPESPEELRRICKKAMALDLDARYPTARAMRDDIDAFLSSIGDRTTLRAVGATVAGLFADQREQLRVLIERAVAESRASSQSRLPMIALDATNEGAIVRYEVGSFDVDVVPPAPRLPALATNTGNSSAALVTPSGAAIDIHSTSPPPRRGLLVVAGALLALLVVAVAVVAVVVVRQGRKADRELASAGTASATVSSARGSPSPPPEPSAEPAPPTPSVAAASASATTSAPVATSAPKPPPPRVVYVHAPAPKPPPPKPPPAAEPKPKDCNPPFYFEGTKKVFKPGCL